MPKTCVKCEVEKDDAEFKYGKVTRTDCKECHNKWRREAAKAYKEKAASINKTCTLCNAEKPGSQFAYSSLVCKPCKTERDKEENNRPTADAPPKTCAKCTKEQPATEFRYQSKVCLSCEKARLYEWRKDNPDKFKSICKKYRDKPDYREKQNTYKRTRYELEIDYKLQTLFRNRVRFFIKGEIGKTKSGKAKYEKLLGCSWDLLRVWLESNFAEGMTWENYGTVWHVDHTMPCSVFDFKDEESIKSCFNWTNLAPMIGAENISKSNKVNISLVTSIKEKARAFITTHLNQILVESLPADLRIDVDSRVLDTKVSSKDDAGV